MDLSSNLPFFILTSLTSCSPELLTPTSNIPILARCHGISVALKSAELLTILRLKYDVEFQPGVEMPLR